MDKDYFRTTRYYITEDNQYLLLLRITYVDNWQTPFGTQYGFAISYYYIFPYDCIINSASSCLSKLPDISNFIALDSDIPLECIQELSNLRDLLAIKTGSIKEVSEETGYYINIIANTGVIRDREPVLYKNYLKCGGNPVIISNRIRRQYECINLGSHTTRLQIYDTDTLSNYPYNISKEDYDDIKNAYLFYMLKIYAKLALAYTSKIDIRPII